MKAPKQNSMDRAFAAGFACGAANCTKSDTPYKGHNAGYRRGMSNQWDNGYEEGQRVYVAQQAISSLSGFADSLISEANNRIVAGDYLHASAYFSQASTKLRACAINSEFVHKSRPSSP